jgi:hypothetical protein
MNTDKKKSVKACTELVEVSVRIRVLFSFIRGAPQARVVSYLKSQALFRGPNLRCL